MAKPTLGFPTRKAAEENVRRILRENESRPGLPIAALDADFVSAMLSGHPTFADKFGSVDNIEHHVVMPDDMGSRGFRTQRRDNGKLVEWSYRTALNGTQREPREDVVAALREEVKSWIHNEGRRYDAQFLPERPQCYEFDGEIPWDGGELHHFGDYPFVRIVYEFMRSPFAMQRGLDWDSIHVKKAGVGRVILVDRDIAAEWVRFHAEFAHIVRVSKASHKRLTAQDHATLKAAGFGGNFDAHYSWKDFGDAPLGEAGQ